MSVRTLQFEQLQETLYHERLSNGLDVYVSPKAGFHKTYAIFSTKYGSIDNHFVTSNGETLRVPDGIAHFLEHKMFEEEEGDVFDLFSRYGAQANAFTSFDMTSYLFSCTDHVEQNVTTLLNFVQNPYFTDQSVEKEKGIIEQEIRMYQDNPDWRAYFGLIEALYERFPINIDIAGTVESIYQIDKSLLYTCYHTFYHPANMMLFIVGPVNPEEILNLVRENQAQKSFDEAVEIERLFPEEPVTVAKRQHEIKLNVDTPKILLGFKEQHVGLEGKQLLKQELATQIVLEMLFGPTADAYEQLLEAGLIDSSFSTDFSVHPRYGFSVIGGNSVKPDELLKELRRVIQHALQSGLEEDEFERIRKQKIGHFLSALNSPEFIATQFTRYKFNGIDLFDVVPLLESLSFPEIEERLQQHCDEERMAVCIVH